MVHHRMYVGRKDRLRVVVDRHSRVGPPEEGLRQAGAVVDLRVDFDVCLVGENGKGRRTARADHVFRFSDHDGAASVRILADCAVDRVKGARAVVLRPVEFDAAADPRPGQPDERGLDHVVIVNKIIAVRFVIRALDPAAQFGQDHHKQIFIFQAERLVGAIHLFIINFINDTVRVHPAAAALIHPLFQKHRVFIGLADRIGRNHYIFPPDGYAFGNLSHHRIHILLENFPRPRRVRDLPFSFPRVLSHRAPARPDAHTDSPYIPQSARPNRGWRLADRTAR